MDLIVELHEHEADPGLGRRLERIERRLELVLAALGRIIGAQGELMADLTDLQAAVDADLAVDTSAITLIEGLADALEAAAGDPAQVAALAAQLRGQSASLAAAVLAHTPAAPEPPVDGEPVE